MPSVITSSTYGDTPDGEASIDQSISEEELTVNDYNDDFKITIDVEASNNVERFIEEEISPYANLLADNKAIYKAREKEKANKRADEEERKNKQKQKEIEAKWQAGTYISGLDFMFLMDRHFMKTGDKTKEYINGNIKFVNNKFMISRYKQGIKFEARYLKAMGKLVDELNRVLKN